MSVCRAARAFAAATVPSGSVTRCVMPSRVSSTTSDATSPAVNVPPYAQRTEASRLEDRQAYFSLMFAVNDYEVVWILPTAPRPNRFSSKGTLSTKSVRKFAALQATKQNHNYNNTATKSTGRFITHCICFNLPTAFCAFPAGTKGQQTTCTWDPFPLHHIRGEARRGQDPAGGRFLMNKNHNTFSCRMQGEEAWPMSTGATFRPTNASYGITMVDRRLVKARSAT
ncbi:hypothetical protein S40288_11221 [Stachybotrys chartarum IBT 40288]|nr:hypothetical protein S40288_11221 [Stachybotrys chartarum IBT 40288]